jgi:negative regulator of flagellin synthesis FlgM
MNIKDIKALGGVSPIDASRSNATAPRRSEAGHSTSPTATAAADQLTLTDVGQYLASSAGEPAPVDRERVDAIRHALADGSYEIDPERVAARLLRLDRELI